MEKEKICRFSIIFIFVMFLLYLGYYYFLSPQINLKGDKNIIIDYNSKYSEPGYSANYFNKDLSNSVNVSGSINSKKLGKYEITYSVSNGFVSTSKKRYVYVKDISKPKFIIPKNDEVTLCPNKVYKKEKIVAIDNYDGDITKNVKYELINNKAIYSVSDSSGNVAKYIKKINNIDKVSPVIILNGLDIVYSFVNEKYVDSGYTAYDNCDGDITSKVTVTGSVNNNKIGEYVLNYSVSDSSGNKVIKKRKVIVTERGKHGSIYLTFDDGPQSDTTGAILDILKEEGVKATFFVTNKGPDELIKREFDEGHTVALHTASHDYSDVYASVDNYFKDLYIIRDRVKRITGHDSKIIRFPGGSSNTISRRYTPGIMSYLSKEVVNRGYKYFDWNVSSGDAAGGRITSEFVKNNVINGIQKDRVNIVLLHDIKYATRDALRDIIRYGKENGYSFEKITSNTEMLTHRVNN